MDKSQLMAALKRSFLRTGVYGGFRRMAPNANVAILRYHAVVEPGDNHYTSPGIALSPAEFERHVAYFSRHYTVMSLDALVDCLREGTAPPRNAVIFTFDDGYADNLAAARILHKYGATATFYITTEPIGRESRLWLAEVTSLMLRSDRPEFTLSVNGETHTLPLSDRRRRWKAIREVVRTIKSNDRTVRESVMAQVEAQLATPELLRDVESLILTWDQVREMQALGMTIAAHTTTHLNLPNAAPEDARREIGECRTRLEAELDRPVRHFSYPNSGPYEYFTPAIREMVIAAGYDSATTSNQGFAHPGSDPYAIDRVRTVPALEEVVHSMEWERVL